MSIVPLFNLFFKGAEQFTGLTGLMQLRSPLGPERRRHQSKCRHGIVPLQEDECKFFLSPVSSLYFLDVFFYMTSVVCVHVAECRVQGAVEKGTGSFLAN